MIRPGLWGFGHAQVFIYVSLPIMFQQTLIYLKTRIIFKLEIMYLVVVIICLESFI